MAAVDATTKKALRRAGRKARVADLRDGRRQRGGPQGSRKGKKGHRRLNAGARGRDW